MAAVTIHGVARRAGVSIKTVSRVLNHEPNVRDNTRERVLRAVADLDYRPNLSARSLAGARSYLIALYYDNPSTGYIAGLQLGAIRRCRASGYHLLVEPLDAASPEFKQEMARVIGTVRVDGVILTPPVSDNIGVMQALEAAETPYVRVSPAIDRDRAPCVEMDDAKAAYMMTAHLIDLGHRDIGFIIGPPGHVAAHRRREGFLAALKDHGIKPQRRWMRQGQFTFRSGYRCAEALLGQDERPTAIFASNDDMALGVMTYAHRLGLSLPADLSVSGFDDTPAAATVWPQLTTIRQPIVEMAMTAAELLISGKAAEHHRKRPIGQTLDFEIVVRGSTARLGQARPRIAASRR